MAARVRRSIPLQLFSARWRIIFLLLCVTTFAFTTRLSMSYAARGIQSEYGLNNIQVGWILSAFVIGYGLFQIPVGLIIDRWGPRLVLTVALLAWSGCTLATVMVPAAFFIAMRAATGVAQAAVLPSGNKMVSRWMPASERAAGNSVFFTGIGVGGLIAPPLTVGLMLRYGWRTPFWMLGIAGMAIAGLWRWYARDTPEQHSGVGCNELQLIQAGRERPASGVAAEWNWGTALRSGSVWALVLSYGV